MSVTDGIGQTLCSFEHYLVILINYKKQWLDGVTAGKVCVVDYLTSFPQATRPAASGGVG